MAKLKKKKILYTSSHVGCQGQARKVPEPEQIYYCQNGAQRIRQHCNFLQ